MFTKKQLGTIIFETSTTSGKIFDAVILGIILLSVIVVMASSVESLNLKYGPSFEAISRAISIIFLVEYLLRIRTADNKIGYIFSFYGIIDAISVLPIFFLGIGTGSSLLVVRSVRLLRLFRVFKLGRYMSASSFLRKALQQGSAKITVFLLSVFIIVLIVGTLMHVIEGPEAGFTDIPTSVYRAIVTITTVGYGDITPVTPFGQFLSAALMILGYGIIAVPTGIISAEIATSKKDGAIQK